MSVYAYSALDRAGKTRRGLIDGDTEREVRDQLRARGMIPLSLKPARSGDRPRWRGRPLARTELVVCLRQLAILLSAGAPLDTVLERVSRQSRRPAVSRLLMSVRARVMDGESLAEALGAHAREVPSLYRAIIAAGERTGRLEEALRGLGDHAAREIEFSRQLKLALLYPATVCVVAVVTLSALLTLVVPKLTVLFDERDEPLPRLTQAVVSASDFVSAWGWLLALVPLALLLVYQMLPVEHPFRLGAARWVLRVPGLSYLIRVVESLRLLETLRLASGASLPLTEALELATEAVSNRHLRAELARTLERLQEGMSFHDALAEGDWLAPAVLDLVAAGEQSAKLGSALEHAAEYQTMELDTVVKTGLGVLEPILIVLLGLGVLLIVFAVMAPLYQLDTLLG